LKNIGIQSSRYTNQVHHHHHQHHGHHQPHVSHKVCNKTVGLTELFLNKRNES
jgi:hypothetical protein